MRSGFTASEPEMEEKAELPQTDTNGVTIA